MTYRNIVTLILLNKGIVTVKNHQKVGMPRGTLRNKKRHSYFNEARGSREPNVSETKSNFWIPGLSVSRPLARESSDAMTKLANTSLVGARMSRQYRASGIYAKSLVLLEESQYVRPFHAIGRSVTVEETLMMVKFLGKKLRESLKSSDTAQRLPLTLGGTAVIGRGDTIIAFPVGWDGPRSHYANDTFNGRCTTETGIIHSVINTGINSDVQPTPDLSFVKDATPFVTIARKNDGLVRDKELRDLTLVLEDKGIFEKPIEVFDPLILVRLQMGSDLTPIAVRSVDRENNVELPFDPIRVGQL